MDGIPNTPGGASDEASQPVAICPTCGETVPLARFCGACGASLAAEPGPTSGVAVAVATEPAQPAEADQVASAPAAAAPYLPPVPPPPPMWQAGSDQAAPAGPAAPVAGDGKTCPWCGAVNPPGATTCSSCKATFPTPEGDEALERAARERIEEMQKEINKPRGSSWWPFRSR